MSVTLNFTREEYAERLSKTRRAMEKGGIDLLLVTDPARMPKQFKEAPMLAEQVRARALPPVEQRLPQDMMVVQPLRAATVCELERAVHKRA